MFTHTGVFAPRDLAVLLFELLIDRVLFDGGPWVIDEVFGGVTGGVDGVRAGDILGGFDGLAVEADGRGGSGAGGGRAGTACIGDL